MMPELGDIRLSPGGGQSYARTSNVVSGLGVTTSGLAVSEVDTASEIASLRAQIASLSSALATKMDAPPLAPQASTGRSYSANLPALSTLGTLLATVPPNVIRRLLSVENQSANVLTLVGDVGDDTQVWHRKLIGTGSNQQGADWTSTVFTGRLRIYGLAGSQVSIAEF